MIRIAYVDPHPVPGEETESLQILQCANAMAEVGAHVTVITPRAQKMLTAESLLGRPASTRLSFLPVYDHRKRWYFPFASHTLFTRQVRRILRSLPVDALYVRNLKLADQLLRTPRLPALFFETHEWFAQTYREMNPQPTARVLRKLAQLEKRETFVYQNSAGVVGLTHALMDDLSHAYPITPKQLVAADGVDLFLAKQAYATHRPPAEPILLYLGSLHPWKGVETLVDALPFISHGILRIVGPGATQAAALHERARALGVAHRLVLAGAIPAAQRFHEIAAADICLLPSSDSSIGSRYTSPLKLFEYLSMGKPVIAANLPALREIVTHDKNALLFKVGDAPALAQTINALLTHPQRMQRLATEAKQLAAQHDWTSRSAHILEWIHQTQQQCT